jgi:hypothetical protein
MHTQRNTTPRAKVRRAKVRAAHARYAARYCNTPERVYRAEGIARGIAAGMPPSAYAFPTYPRSARGAA